MTITLVNGIINCGRKKIMVDIDFEFSDSWILGTLKNFNSFFFFKQNKILFFLHNHQEENVGIFNKKSGEEVTFILKVNIL